MPVSRLSEELARMRAQASVDRGYMSYSPREEPEQGSVPTPPEPEGWPTLDNLIDQQVAPPYPEPLGGRRGQTVSLREYEQIQQQQSRAYSRRVMQQIPPTDLPMSDVREGRREYPSTYLDILDDQGDIEWSKLGSVPMGRANELLVQAFNALQQRIRALERAANAPQN